MLFFLAGYETTAASIAFLLYNLTLNPEMQEKLHEEIMDVAGDQVNNTSFFLKFLLDQGPFCGATDCSCFGL